MRAQHREAEPARLRRLDLRLRAARRRRCCCHAWVRTCVTERGYALSRLSAEYRELWGEHERLQLRAAELKSPQRIEELARTRLNMGPPPVDRVVVLVGGAVRPSMLAASR